MITVYVDKHGSIDKALRVFERKCRRAHIFQEMQQRSFYMSRSEKKHRRKNRRSK